MNNKIALTIDLDDWYHTPLIAGADFSKFKNVDEFFENWTERYDYLTEPTMRLLKIFEKENVTATFFIIADQVDRYPELMRELKKSRHEIANHSLHHTIPYNTKTKENTQSPKQWEEELLTANSILEKYFEREIKGFRAPGAYLADWMIPILKKNGFTYDSSVVYNSLYNKSNFTDLSRLPRTAYWAGNKGEQVDYQSGFLEIPWPSLKLGSLFLPGGGAFFFRVFGVRYFQKLLKQNLNLGDTVFYIHSLDLAEENFPLSNFRHRPFYWINKGRKTEKNLIRLLKGLQGNFDTCQNIYLRHLLNESK